MTEPFTTEEARQLDEDWKQITEPAPDYDPECPVRMSSLADLAPLADRVPSRWLGDDYDRVYSVMIRGVTPDEEWTAMLFASDEYREIREIAEASRNLVVGV